METEYQRRTYFDRIYEELCQQFDNPLGPYLNETPRLLKSAIQCRAWEHRKGNKVNTFQRFVMRPRPKGLGITLKELKELCKDDPTALDIIQEQLWNDIDILAMEPRPEDAFI
jgi:hypothetical protein